MKIDFFNTCNGRAPRAINHGVYMIELLEYSRLDIQDIREIR